MVGLDVAAAIVGNDAKDCKGKFASARNSELIDSEVVFRGMSSCEDFVIVEVFYFSAQGGRLHFVLSPDTDQNNSAQIPGQQRDEMNAGFRKAAYTSISP